MFCSSTRKRSRSITILWKKSAIGISFGFSVLSADCRSMVPPAHLSPRGTISVASLQSLSIFNKDFSVSETVSTSIVTFSGMISSSFSSVLSISFMPVSYTHLDVYKRQVVLRKRRLLMLLLIDTWSAACFWVSWWMSSLLLKPLSVSVCSIQLRARAVSYTHLDVYKRQFQFCFEIADLCLYFFCPDIVFLVGLKINTHHQFGKFVFQFFQQLPCCCLLYTSRCV